jgi:hypothetical protein
MRMFLWVRACVLSLEKSSSPLYCSLRVIFSVCDCLNCLYKSFLIAYVIQFEDGPC